MEQPTQAVEQVEQTRHALGSVELILLLHGQPRHPPTLGGQCVTGTGQLLLFHEQLLARSLPLSWRHDFSVQFHLCSFHFVFSWLFVSSLKLSSEQTSLNRQSCSCR